MSRKHQGLTFGNVFDLIDKNNAFFLESLYNIFVMNNLVININRCTEMIQGHFQAVDRHIDPSTESTR